VRVACHVDPKAAIVSRRKPPWNVLIKPQAVTKFLSHAGENVSRKSLKPALLKAFSFTDYQLITKLISIMDNITNPGMITSILDAILLQTGTSTRPTDLLTVANIFGRGPNNK